MKWKVRLVIQSLQQPEKVYVSVYKNLAVLPAPMFVAAVRSCSLEGYSCHYASVVSQKRRGGEARLWGSWTNVQLALRNMPRNSQGDRRDDRYEAIPLGNIVKECPQTTIRL
uniref:Uncharacterized protein n=1 Tax=Candidozyma auris TaxID=498019 RepID=A0A0L0P3Z2_CANAR